MTGHIAMTKQALYVAVLLFSIFTITVTAPLAAHALSVSSLTPTLPSFSNLNGDRVETFEVGQQLIIITTFTNEVETGQPYVAIVEVRDSSGITMHLAFQSGVIAPNANTTIGASWVVQEPSEHSEYYVARAFAFSSFEDPQVLSIVLESSIEPK